MRLKQLAVAVALAMGYHHVKPLKRARVRDAAFPFRMGAGFAGDINRTHPFEVEAAMINATTPPTAYGQTVIVDTTNGVRPLAAADTAITVGFGLTVRPFPTQQSSGGMSSSFGSATPPTSGAIDVLRNGLMIVQLNTGVPKKGDPVFVWCAATAGAHIQGGFEVAASGGNTAALDPNRYQYAGPPDAAGLVEISWNV